MPRFVILRHDTPPGYPRPAHYDLMLEQGAVLATWACDAMPAVGAEVTAERLADHRPAFLDYEGEVAGGRGEVTRVIAGDYQLVEEADGLLRVQLVSPELSGLLSLTREAGHAQRWCVSLAAGDSPSA